jgi:hypothetical protein
MCLETWSTRTRTSAAATSSVSAMNFSPSLIWLRNCSHIARRFCRAAATHSPKQRCVVSLYALARQPLRQSCNTPLSPHVHMHVHPHTSKWLRTNCITSSVHAWGAQARLDTLSTAGVEGVQRANASIDESCVSQPRTPLLRVVSPLLCTWVSNSLVVPGHRSQLQPSSLPARGLVLSRSSSLAPNALPSSSYHLPLAPSRRAGVELCQVSDGCAGCSAWWERG